MVGYDRAMRYGKNCGSCVHFDNRGHSKDRLKSELGGCKLHSFIPYTSVQNICEEHEQ